MTDSNLTVIYSGSNVTANLVCNYLESMGIEVYLMDSFQNSLNAGWVSPNTSVKVMVPPDHSKDAIVHLKDFFSGSSDDGDE
ncbi:MAG: hypothetical protein ACPG6V_01815 [Flavobacteriales bacterium]